MIFKFKYISLAIIIYSLIFFCSCRTDSNDVYRLIIALKNESWKVRPRTVRKLRNVDDFRVIDPLSATKLAESLIKVLKDSKHPYSYYYSDELRRDVHDCLLKIGSPSVEPLIASLANNILYVCFTIEMLNELGESHNPEVITTLIGLLSINMSLDNHRCVLYGLIHNNDPRIVNAFYAVLKNKNEESILRGTAAQELVALDDPMVLDMIIELLEDKEETDLVKDEMLDALIKLGPSVAKPLIDYALSHEVSFRINHSLTRAIGEVASPKHIKYILDRASGTSLVSASRLLIDMRKYETFPFLIETLFVNGSEYAANVFLNSGNSSLYNAADKWCKEHGYQIIKKDYGSNTRTFR
jgi:hypothetical protein